MNSEKLARYNELKTLLENPPQELYANGSKLKKLNAEYDLLSKEYTLINLINSDKESVKSLKIDLNTETDKEMSKMISDEIYSLEQKLSESEILLNELQTPRDPKDIGDCIIELRAGTGGDEAGLFTADLLRMYSKYCLSHDFAMEILETSTTTSGAFKQVIAEIKGVGAYGLFKNESGVHRVQRIPATESAGRIHTSAASVVVLPIIEPGEVTINEKDLRIDVYRSSGAGGQGVNTTDSAVRITHMPSGIVVTCQDGRSQIKNKESALSVLRSKLYDLEQSKTTNSITDLRKSSIKTGDRSDKIKTYNFPQNRLTDHRTKQSWFNLDSILEGNIDEVLRVNLQAADLSGEVDED